MKYQICTVALLVLTVSCSTTIKSMPGTDNVMSRIDDLKERPEWFKESQDVQVLGDKIVFWGRSTLKRDERIESGYKISELAAKAKIANYVSERINSITQTAEEVSDTDRSLFKEIITQRSQVRLSGIVNGKRYWEKVLVTTGDGESVVEHRVFQSVEIRKSDLQKLVKDALLQGKNKLSEEFSEKVEAEWSDIKEG